MKKIITLVSCLISFSCLFSRGWKGDDTIAFRDSLMRKVEHLPADTSRLSVLLDAAYLHQNPPYNVFLPSAFMKKHVSSRISIMRIWVPIIWLSVMIKNMIWTVSPFGWMSYRNLLPR